MASTFQGENDMNTSSVDTNGSVTNGEDDKRTRAAIRAAIAESKPTYDLTRDTLWSACHYVDHLAKKEGLVTEKRSNALNSAAVSLLSTVIDPGNPSLVRDGGPLLTVEWVQSNWAVIKRKYLNLKEGRKDTYDNYETKLNFLCEAFKSRCTDPENFSVVDTFVERKAGGESENGGESMKASPKKKALQAQPTSNEIQIPIGPQQIVRIELPPNVSELTPAQVSTIIIFLSSQVTMSADDMRKLIGRLAPQMEGYDYNRTVADQLFSKS
jgi:hypothetical protein